VSDVKRYTAAQIANWMRPRGPLDEDYLREHKPFVKALDYDTLKAERDTLKAERDTLMRALRSMARQLDAVHLKSLKYNCRFDDAVEMVVDDYIEQAKGE